MERGRELQKRMCQASEEYFSSRDPVFDSPQEAEESMNGFLEWYSYERDVPGRGKTPAQLYLDSHGSLPELPKFRLPREIHEAGGGFKIGIVFDEVWGIFILAHYDEVKEIFTGDYEKVPDHEELLRALVKKEGFIPPFIIKRMIKKSPDKALEAFRSTYKNLETIEDLYKLFRENRTDWEAEPRSSIIPVRSQPSRRKK